MGAGTSHFVPSFSRSLSDARRLLSRSWSDAARLLSGAAGCVFNVLGRLILRAWMCHLYCLLRCLDEFGSVRLAEHSCFASNAVAVGPFLGLPDLFGDRVPRNDGSKFRLFRSVAANVRQSGS